MDDSDVWERNKEADPSTGPGPGQPTGETLPGESEPTGTEELSKPDVGFGPKDGDSTSGGDSGDE